MVKIFLIPHFHYDTIYQDTYENYLEISFEIIKKAIEILEKNKNYKFLIEQTILLEEFWNRFPYYREKITKFIKNGKIEVAPGFFVMPDMNLISGESLIRQIKKGKNFLKKFNKEPKVAWISDCWGHHRQIPQILKKAGYKAYVFSRGMLKGKKNPIHFIWKGIDNSEILAYWMATGYFGFFIHSIEKSYEEYLKDIEKHLKVLKNLKIVDLVLLPNGGDFLKPDLKILKIVDQWNKRNEEKIIFSTPSEYFNEIENKKLPVLNYDFNPMFNGTYTSRIEIKQNNRLCENQIYLLEILFAFLTLENQEKNEKLKGKIEKFENYFLFNQFHDIICGSILDVGYFDVMKKYEINKEIFREVFNEIIDQLTELNENSISIFNQCSFSRKDISYFEIEIPEENEIVIYDGTKEIKTQIIERKNGKAVIGFKFAGRAFERKTIKIKTIKKREKEIINPPFEFENNYFNIKISEKGLISNLIINKREIVNQVKPYFGELIFQRDMGDFWVYYQSPVPGDSRFSEVIEDPYPENVPAFKEGIFQHDTTPSKVIIEKGILGIKVNIEGEIKYWKTVWKYTQSYFVYNDLPYIDFKTKFVAEGKNYRIRVAFPTSIKNGKIRREIPFGIEYQNEGEYPAYNFIDYFDNEKGLCVINKGLPGNGVKDGIIMISLFRAVDMGPNKAKSETGFSFGKEYKFEYRIVPFIPNNREYRPYLYGISFNQPFVAIPGIKWKNRDIYLKIIPFYIPLTCFRRNNNGYLLRIYEPEGKKTKVKIITKTSFKFYETSIEGEKILRNIGEGKKIRLNLDPFEIKTILLKQ
jgi:alpha-mannosidase